MQLSSHRQTLPSILQLRINHVQVSCACALPSHYGINPLLACFMQYTCENPIQSWSSRQKSSREICSDHRRRTCWLGCFSSVREVRMDRHNNCWEAVRRILWKQQGLSVHDRWTWNKNNRCTWLVTYKTILRTNSDKNFHVVVIASHSSSHCISLLDKHLLGMNGAINKRGTNSHRDVDMMVVKTNGACSYDYWKKQMSESFVAY